MLGYIIITDFSVLLNNIVCHTIIQPPPVFGDSSGLVVFELDGMFWLTLSSESDVQPRSFPNPLSSSVPNFGLDATSPSDLAPAIILIYIKLRSFANSFSF